MCVYGALSLPGALATAAARPVNNCVHLQVEAGQGSQTCLLFEGNEPGHSNSLTYSQVLDEVCRLVGACTVEVTGYRVQLRENKRPQVKLIEC
eukprot:1160404-Pelagomonas_calceolata.AAC.9